MDPREFFYRFGRALYRIDAVYSEFAKQSGVAPTLLWILYALNDGGAHTQREICLDWGLPKSTVNTVMTELRQGGFVTLEPIPGRRREMTVVLTSGGRDYADRVLAPIYRREAEVFEKLGESGRLLDSLEKMETLLNTEGSL